MFTGQGRKLRPGGLRPSSGRCSLGRLEQQLAPPPAAPILPWLCLGRRWEPAFAWPPSPEAVAPWEAWSASSGVSHSRFLLCLLQKSQRRSLPRGHRRLRPRLQGQWTGGVAVWWQASPARPDAISPSPERRGRPGVSAEISPEVPSHDLCAHSPVRATVAAHVSCHFPPSPTSPWGAGVMTLFLSDSERKDPRCIGGGGVNPHIPQAVL